LHTLEVGRADVPELAVAELKSEGNLRLARIKIVASGVSGPGSGARNLGKDVCNNIGRSADKGGSGVDDDVHGR